MPPLIPRIKTYLDHNAGQWVSAPLLYSIAQKHGYLHDEIKKALGAIAHTPPYATWSVSDGDCHAMKRPGITGKGVYYKKHHMTADELQRNAESLELFNEA